MNSLKTGLVALGLMIGTTLMAQERDHKTPEQRAQWRTDRMAKELSLTDAQKTQLNAVNLESVKKSDEIRANASLTPEQKKEAFKTARQADKAKVDALLTTEQKATLEQQRAEMKANMQERRAQAEKWKNATPEERAQWQTDRLAKTLTLTEDQEKQITALNLQSEQKAKAIREDASKTPEQKKAAMKEQHKSRKDGMSKILTPEQMTTLKAAMKAHGKGHSKKFTSQGGKHAGGKKPERAPKQ